jgi:hypothetical protein
VAVPAHNVHKQLPLKIQQGLKGIDNMIMNGKSYQNMLGLSSLGVQDANQ